MTTTGSGIERLGEDRGASGPPARGDQGPAGARSATDDQATTAPGGISLAAVLGGTLLRWGGGTPAGRNHGLEHA